MPSPEPLQPYRKVQSQAETELLAVLESTAKAIKARIAKLPMGIGGDVRGAQLRTTLAAIKKMQRSMWATGIGGVAANGVDSAEKAAEAAIETMTRVAYASLPDAAADALVRGLRLSAESGLKSDRARRKRELSERVYRQAALHEGKVEQVIREGLIANLSARELADTAYKYVSPTAKGGASYAAMRLARTEINNAFHERQLEGAKRPGVRAAKWNLSGSHKVPDECNVYAAHNGTGEWGVDSIPEKPHPQCFCFLTYVTTPPEEFRKRLAAGSFDDEIDRRTRENMALLGQKVGKLEPKADDKPVLAPKKRVPRKKATPAKPKVPNNDRIKASVKSGIDESKSQELSGGAIALTDKVTFRDGKQGVRKLVEELDQEVLDAIVEDNPDDEFILDTIQTPKMQQDAEELASILARALGLKAPEVARVDDNTTIQEFMEGRVAASLPQNVADPFGTYAKSDDGWRIGLLDQLIGNSDRNDGNWIVDSDNRLIPIDHGLAWNLNGILDGSEAPVKGLDVFARLFSSGFDEDDEGEDDFQGPRWLDNDLSPEDLDRVIEILTALRPEFVRLDQEDWWSFSMEQATEIKKHAKGKKRRIA